MSALPIGVFALVLISFLPMRPLPDGPNVVASQELSVMTSKGERIPVTVWYPTLAQTRGAADTHAALAIPTSAPVILYSAGWGGSRSQSSIQVQNLASHGFVVVACPNDPTDPDRGPPFDFSSALQTTLSMERMDRRVEAKANILIEVLGALGTSQAGAFAGRLNLDHVGVLGYSIGGAVGAQAAFQDPRIVAVFNLDGWLFGQAADAPTDRAYFLLSSNQAFPSASASETDRNIARLSELDHARNAARTERLGGYWVAFDSADHEDLSDALFALRRNRIFRSNFERRQINSAIGAFEVAFFKSTLANESAPLLSARRVPYAFVRWISSTPPEELGTASAPR